MCLFIAICDDQQKICAKLEAVLLELLSKLKIRCDIDVYSTGEELCEQISGDKHYDLIFLDIEFAENATNGVQVGKIIRDTHNNNIVSIVYMSWHMEYAMELFDIRPLDFLIKPLNTERIEQVVMTYLRLAEVWSETFSYKIGHDIFKVNVKDMVYLESHDRKIILHLANGQKEEFYGSLKDIHETELAQLDFLFVHAKYVVNYDYIMAMKHEELNLAEVGITLPISRPKRTEVRSHYMTIMEKRRNWRK